ncbi:hypothetical protein POJ06DRAFT_243047 [Lipomyces tetrasporus]|uniref:PH domain-containing protein n=1 Tax=Lipomyces tetrasporus TaxID=54092 RepID=A0AAD7R158_9ASCO|nr:uncharacterized protein POJ06DRAFT_243047 [Lipomyces tetrasporus]KAJ8103877.1 hypothetical protein POJ06DRAFT_243047 [Lipomyces tetrasporus]
MPFLRGFRSRSHSDPALSLASSRRGSCSTVDPLPSQPEHEPQLFDGYTTTTPFYRTRSAPIANAPPQYTAPDSLPPSRFPIIPREEEGCEPLPPYSSTLMRAAVLSRKVEMLSPLEQAPNRSWQNVIAVLNNTQLNIYRAPSTLHTISLVARPQVSGRVASVLPWRSASFSGPTSSEYQLFSSSLPSRINYDTIDPFTLSPLSSATSASSSSASLSPTPTSSMSSSSASLPAALLGADESVLSPANLVRSYTLQYAQIGLATDYKKKQNVIRVRAEGQQFLLLCNDARECVEWTSALQAACDLSLPLDERTIPRCRSIPSRRRRRILPSARHPSSKSAARRRAELASESAPIGPASPAEEPIPTDGQDAGDEPQPAEVAGHDDEDDEEDELYYRRESAGSETRTRPRSDSTATIAGNAEDSGDDQVGELPSSSIVSGNSFPTTRPRRDSVPRSFTTYDDDDNDNEDADAKWAPPPPSSSTNSKLRYAIRCLYSLPADGSWGDKLLMTKGDQFIIRERIFV